MCVVRDLEAVLMLRSCLMRRDNWGIVEHPFADFGHGVSLAVRFVESFGHGAAYFLVDSGIESSNFVIVVLLVELSSAR